MTYNPYRDYSIAEKQAVVTELVSLLWFSPFNHVVFSELIRRLEIILPVSKETRALLGEQEKKWLEEILAAYPEHRGTQEMERIKQLITFPMPQYQSNWVT